MTRNRMRLHSGQRPKMNLRPEAVSRPTGLSHGSIESHLKQRICQPFECFLGSIIFFMVRAVLWFQRTKIRHHRNRVVVIEAELRHGPHGRFAGEINAGLQKRHRLLICEAGQPRNRNGHRGKRHLVVRLEIEDVSLKPLRAVKLALVVARCVAIRAHRHVFHQIFAALDLRVGRGLRPEGSGAKPKGRQTKE